MKHGGSSRRRQMMAQRDAASRPNNADLNQAPMIDTAESSVEPGPIPISTPGNLVTTGNQGIGITAVGTGRGGGSDVSTTSSNGLGADLEIGATEKVAAAALAGAAALSILS